MVDREGEPLRHHANDGVVRVAELDCRVEDVGIRTEPAAPLGVADHHDGCRTRPLVLGADDPAHHRGDTCHVESCRGHLGDLDWFGCSSGGDEVPRHRSEGAEVAHGRELLPPRHDIPRHERLRLSLRRVPLLKRDDAVPLRQRQIGGAQLLPDQREHRGGNRDPDGNPEDGDGTQRWRRISIRTASVRSMRQPVRKRRLRALAARKASPIAGGRRGGVTALNLTYE